MTALSILSPRRVVVLTAALAVATLDCLGPPAAHGQPDFSQFDHLAEYRQVTLGDSDQQVGPHEGSHESRILRFPDLPGPRLLSVRVSHRPFGDGFVLSDPGDLQPPPPLDEVELVVELIDGSGNSFLPVTRTPTLLHTVMMDVPETATGLRYFVESADPTVPFYTSAAADVTLDLSVLLGRLRGELEELADFSNVAKIERAERLFGTGLRKAERAERLARRAFDAFQRGNLDKAARLLQKARANLDKAIKRQQKVKKALRQVARLLERVPLAGSIRATLEAVVRHLCASIEIVRAHYTLYETVFFDVPVVLINTNQPKTAFNEAAMKIKLEPGDEADPSVIKHEYAHAVVFKKTGLTRPEGSHYPLSASSDELAWSEGFATFFGQYMMASPIYRDRAMPPRRDLVMDLESNTVRGAKPEAGTDVESNVQSALWDIVDGDATGIADTDGDGLSVPFATIWECLCDKPTTFTAFETCLRGKLNLAERSALDRVKTRNGL